MTEALLDQPAATHTKSIENYFGRLDGLLKVSTPKGFNKSVDDLIIQYSKDLIGEDKQWMSKKTRAVARALKQSDKEFACGQKKLLDPVSTEEDALYVEAAIAESKVMILVNKLKESHDGPITTAPELHKVMSIYKNDDKKRTAILTLEIRLRKLTLTKIKSSCPLFKQRGISEEVKTKNLESLIASTLKCSATADFEDLRAAITQISTVQEPPECEQVQTEPAAEPPVIPESTISVATEDGIPGGEEEPETAAPITNESEELVCYKQGDFVVGLFEDENLFYVGEIMSVNNGESLKVNFMTRLKRHGPEVDKFWIFPGEPDCHTIQVVH